MLNTFYNEDPNIIEIGVDEAGRGPMLGRVYSAAVILPKDNSFKHELMKDSKKFTSKKKILLAAEYIKENSIAWTVNYRDENDIDKYNIKSATHMAMHDCIRKLEQYKKDSTLLLIDGNDFKPFTFLDNDDMIKQVKNVCVTQGDNKYTCIAAASILAKVARDEYIEELCKDFPKLDEYYNLSKNKGYGTKEHIDGIKKYGITKFHRRTFGLCQNSNLIEI
tara:strand:+ start:802 stop:1464 length:663 start_codon:yes stop_codon:yes gene_type:complete